MREIMSVRSSIASPSERPDSERRVDLHVYIVPTELWQDHLHSAVNQVISDAISAGFIRAYPEMTVSSLRDELEIQLGFDFVPKNYVFLRCVGRCFTRLRPQQERTLKVKHFIPPQTYAPELFLLESSVDGEFRTGISSIGSTSSQASMRSSQFADDKPFPVQKPIPPIGLGGNNEQSTQTGNEGWRSITPKYSRDGRPPPTTIRAIIPVYHQSSKSVQWPNEPEIDDEEENGNSKSSQTSADDLRSSSTVNGAGSLPMLIELHEDERDDGRPAADAAVGTESPVRPPLSATPTEMLNGKLYLLEQEERRRNDGLDEAERQELMKLVRARKEEEQRLQAEKEQKEREERAKREAEEVRRNEEERRRRQEDEERRRKAEQEREEQLRRQMLEEQRKIDQEWEQLNADKQQLEEQRKKDEERKRLEDEERRRAEEQRVFDEKKKRLDEAKADLEEQRKKAAEQNRLDLIKKMDEERKRIDQERVRLEEQRKKDEERKRKLEQENMNQKQAQELIKQIDELKSKRIQSERAKDELISTARQLQNRARNNRSTGRDVWKKKYFEEKRKTAPLDENVKKLRTELDGLHKKILHQMESNRRDVGVSSGTVSSAGQTPSEKSNLKIQAVRLQQEVESVQRRIADTNMKLTAEIKLRYQVEQENRSLKAELAQRRSQQLAGKTTNRYAAGAPMHWAEAKTTAR